ncbi:MAG: DNA polymerase domain-containing protein [Candidatus Heimdallarchaeaceae archaeon]
MIKIKENGKIKEITNYSPYFYIRESEINKIPSQLNYEDGYKSIFGENLIKIETNLPSDVRTFREHFTNHYEADILFVERYLIDKYKSSIIPKQNLRWCILDIEVGCDRFPDMMTFSSPIISISFYDSFKQFYYTLIWRKDLTPNLEKREIDDKIWYILWFNDELCMLEKFSDYLHKIDIVCGWNVMNFDMYYLLGRMKRLGLNIDTISKSGSIKWDEKYREVSIDGVAIFDLMIAYTKIVTRPLSSKSLQYVANIELNASKTDIKNFLECWNEDIETLVDRNVRDVMLCRKIEEKYGLIDYFDEIRRICKCQFGELRSSFLVDNYIIGFCKERNIILPSKKKGKKESIVGALVLEPKKGLYENVMVFDLKSLYPSIIINFNMSPETLDENGEIKIEIEELNKSVRFRDNKVGIYPEILKDLIRKRDEMKKKRDEFEIGCEEWKSYDYKQTAFKYLTNAFYGVLGNENFRLFTPDIANAVTAIGRKCLLWSKKIIENEGYRVIYGDTDGLFALSKGDPVSEGKKLESILNESYIDFLKGFGVKENITLKTKFEKLYSRLYLSTKKRYAGRLIWQEGRECDVIDIKGLEAKRSNSSDLARKVQKEIFEILLKEDDAIKKLKLLYQKYKNEIMNIDENEPTWRAEFLEKIAIPVPINKDVYQYKTNIPMKRGVIWSNKNLGLELNSGERVYIIYVKNVFNYPKTDVVAFREYRDLDNVKFLLDKQKHCKEIVESKFSFIMEEFTKQQTTLFSI